MTDHVYVGPSLAPDRVREVLPGAVVHPPVRHGDLLRLDVGPGDRVLLIDGLFMQTAPVRHREILGLLARGVVVAGSSSMGALRAAELHVFGMRGVGRVFELYRDGVVTGDDEVAVVYGPAEDDYPILSQPLVDQRIGLERSVAAGVLPAADAERVLAAASALPFRLRSTRALRRFTAGDPAAAAYLDWFVAHPVDAKAEDALALLQAAVAGSLAPAGPDDRPIRNLDTTYAERWRARHGGAVVAGRLVPDADTVSVLMAMHPDFPAAHRRQVLGELTGSTPGTPETVVRDRSVALARERGLIGPAGELAPEVAAAWLTPTEQRALMEPGEGGTEALGGEPGAELPVEEAALRVLVRAFGTRGGAVRSPRAVPDTLLDLANVAAARHFARRASAVNDRLPRPPHTQHRMFFRPAVIDETVAALWGCPISELSGECWDRGLVDVIRMRAVLEPFVALLRISGRPEFSNHADQVA